jgi:hypothetical protein
MKRSNRDLTCRSIRQKGSSSVKRQDDINKRAGEHQYKSPSTPLLVDNQSLPLSADQEEQSTTLM